jgi:F0F1-type ATP synthase delta subunit
MNENFENLLEKIVTKEELIEILEQIDEIRSQIFKDNSLKQNKKRRAQNDSFLWKYLKNLEFKNPLEKERFLLKLTEKLKQLPELKLEIAFEARPDFLKYLAQWLKEQTNQKIILNVIFKPEIVGGVIIEYQGKRFDFSLAKKIDETLKTIL